MTEEKPEEMLNHINDQIGELIDLMEKERNASLLTKALNELKRSKDIFRKKWVVIGLLLSIGVTIFWMLSSEEFTYNIYFVFLSFIRLILIKILPLWDWTTIYTNPCFVNNPFYNNSLASSECDKCLNITEVVRESNITFFNFTKNIHFDHLPVIVDDATQSWAAMKELTVKKLFQLYTEDPVLAEHDLCRFESNVPQYNQAGGADRLFSDYLFGTRRPFMAQWNNCKRETLKTIRSFYSKPYFLPPSVGQTLMGNWFLVSSGLDKGKQRFHKIPVGDNWVWLAQIQGSSSIELRPSYPCENRCEVLKSIQLNRGDLIIYSYLYQAFYSPLNKETVLLAQGVD